MSDRELLIFIAIYIILYPIIRAVLNMVIGDKDETHKS